MATQSKNFVWAVGTATHSAIGKRFSGQQRVQGHQLWEGSSTKILTFSNMVREPIPEMRKLVL